MTPIPEVLSDLPAATTSSTERSNSDAVEDLPCSH